MCLLVRLRAAGKLTQKQSHSFQSFLGFDPFVGRVSPPHRRGI